MIGLIIAAVLFVALAAGAWYAAGQLSDYRAGKLAEKQQEVKDRNAEKQAAYNEEKEEYIRKVTANEPNAAWPEAASEGWDVIDLGKDVPAEAIAAAVKENSALAVGLSALMTTTLPAMEEAVAAVKALEPAPFVMVGGAVVTADYAASIGADGYAKDAREAAEVLKAVMK